ncbi:ribosomal-processing cysteine protease Prp [Dysosmobacter sp. Marseille-Q4140]|nr:ribosomal-processing cysteine protease Prp [Dysosmobacter sp. Marseille-Q4140]
MITINMCSDPTEDAYNLRIEGHAGYAPEGQDIVCAAVSALALSLHGWLAAHPEICLWASRDSGGSARFLFHRTPGSRAVYEMLSAGLSSIAAEYPEYVRISREVLH